MPNVISESENIFRFYDRKKKNMALKWVIFYFTKCAA